MDINKFVKRVPSKFNKLRTVRYANGVSRVVRYTEKRVYYQPTKTTLFTKVKKILDSTPRLVSYKPLADPGYLFVVKPTPQSSCWSEPQSGNYVKILCKNLHIYKLREQAQQRKKQIFKFNDNYLWDIRYLFRHKAVFTPSGDTDFCIGYLDNKKLHGPLPKEVFYYKLNKKLALRRSLNPQFYEECKLNILNLNCTYRKREYIPKVPGRIITTGPRIKKVKSLPNLDFSCIDDFDWKGKTFESVEIKRDETLLAKLKNIISLMGILRLPAVIRKMRLERIFNGLHEEIELQNIDPCEEVLPEMLDPQMENDSHGEKIVPTISSKNDTTIIDQAAPSSDIMRINIGNSWNKMSTTEKAKECAEFVERDLLVGQFNWSTNNPFNTLLMTKILPFEFTNANMESPFTLLMRQHKYWRGDMFVRFQVNGNAMMTGKVQVSFYYGASYDSSYKDRSNVWSQSQMLHCILDASASNPGEIIIPYAHMYPYLPTQRRDVDSYGLNLGTLQARVLNKLRTTSSVSNTITITMYMGFTNVHSVGQVASRYALTGTDPQMEEVIAGLAVNLAEKYLVNSFADDNRDMPTAPIVAQPIQIASGGNLSYGSNIVDFAHSLRLNPTGQTPYPFLNRNEMYITDFTRCFGLVARGLWSMDDRAGRLLANFPASPVWRNSDYPRTTINQKSYSVLPPVSYISNMFKQFRGTIEYKIEFASNAFYTGTIGIGYIPGINTDSTLNQVKCGNYMSFELKEQRSFTFITPFITDRPWWPRPYSGSNFDDDFKPPGSVQMFVINPLVINNLVATTIEYNVYIRGGCDFELSVPVQPSISCSNYEDYSETPSKVDAYPLEGYTPYYVGTSRYYRDNTKAILRYGVPFDDIVVFTPLKTTGYYVYSGTPMLLREKVNGVWVKSSKLAKYGVAITNEWNETHWMGICGTEADAQNYIKTKDDQYLYDYPNDDLDNYYGTLTLPWKYHKWPAATDDIDEDSSSSFECIDAQNERHSTTMIVDSKGCLNATGFGYDTFGENFSRITDLLRRYQFVDSFSLEINKQVKFKRIRLNKAGMAVDFAKGEKWKFYGREGVNGLIACCYRFFRGGDRIKISCTSAHSNPLLLYIQHRPDDTSVATDKDSVTTFCQGYATHVHNLTLNPIVTLEIPFYLDSVYGYLGYSDDKVATKVNNLGNLFIGVEGEVPEANSKFGVNCNVFQALADDSKFELFQGTLPVKFIEFEEVDPQMAEDEEVTPQWGVFDALKANVSKASETMDNTNRVSSKLENILDKADDLWQQFVGEGPLSTLFTLDKFICVLSQFGHMLLNPNWKTVALGIATIFVSLLGIGYTYIKKLYNVVVDYLEPLHLFEQNGSVEGQGSEKCYTSNDSLIAMLVSLISVAVNFKGALPGAGINSLRRFFSDVSIFARGFDGIIKLMHHIFNCSGAILRRILLYFSGKPDVHALLRNHGKEMTNWAIHIEDLLDLSKESQNEIDDSYSDKIHDAYFTGTIYLSQLATCDQQSQAFQYVRLLMDRIREMKDKLIRQGKHPYTRLTPFAIWLEGKPGLGKSSIVTSIVTQCLREINYKERRVPIYKFEPLNDHWDTCNGQPFYVIDDAFSVNTPTTIERLLGAYYCVVTNAPFTPPMAHLHNKNLRVNPLGLITCSNFAFPTSNAINDEEAFYRRRHVMYEVSLKPGCEKHMKEGNICLDEFDKDQKANFVWLQFRQHSNPRVSDENSLGEAMDFQTFKKRIAGQFRAFYEKEVEHLTTRIETMMAFLNSEATPDAEVIEIKQKLADTWIDKAKALKNKVVDILTASDASWKREHPDGSILSQELQPGICIPSVSSPQNEPVNPPSPLIDAFKLVVDDMTSNVKDIELLQNVTTSHLAFFQEYYKNSKIDLVLGKDIKALDFVDTQDMKLVVKAVSDQPISSEEHQQLQRILNVMVKRMETHFQDRKCEHILCECYGIVEVNKDEWAVPLCETCKEAERKPVKMTFCGPYCALLSALSYPFKWLGCKMHKYVSTVYNFCISMLRKGLLSFIQVSKKIVKTVIPASYYLISKCFKIVCKYVLPFVGLYFIGQKFIPDRHQAAAMVGNAGGYLLGKTIAGVSNVYDMSDTAKEKLITLFDSYGNKFLVPQTVYEHATAPAGTPRILHRNLQVKQLLKAQGVTVESVSNSYIDTILRIINNNSYNLVAQYPDGETYKKAQTRGVFIRNRQFLMVTHCWDELVDRVVNKNAILYLIKTPSFCIELDLNKLDVHKFIDSNLCIIDMDIRIPEHKNIVKHIPTKKQHDLITSRCSLITKDEAMQVRHLDVKFVDSPKIVRATPHSEAITMVGCYSYNFGGNGICGSILLCNDTNPCIIGIHVAGLGSTQGYSEPLIKDMFEEVKTYNVVDDIVLPELKDLNLSKHNIDGTFLQLGTVDPQLAHSEVGKTQIVPSLCHGIFPVITAPNPLNVGDPRLPPGCSPMFEGVSKLGEPIMGFPRHCIQFIRDHLITELCNKVKPIIGVKPLSLQDAICGRPGIRGFSSINFHTSEGYPLSGFRPNGVYDKKYLFDLEVTETGYKCKGLNNRLKNILEYKQSLRKNNIIPATVFVDCLKDKRLPLEKCKIPGKTRIFSISPVDFSIQFREYFLPYTVSHQNSDGFSSCIGINANGLEWSKICFEMSDHSPYQLDGDYSNFGSSFDIEVHSIVHDAILQWFKFYGDDDPINHRVRSIMFKELLHPLHLCFDIMYRTIAGMPSGSPITTETNDLVNLCYIMMAWHEIMRGTKYNTYYYFCKFVKIKTYGDDLWLAIHPFVITWFNNETIQNFFKRFGVKYTSATKGDTIVPYVDIYNVSFLKRTPVNHPFRKLFLAKLDLDLTLDIANWCWQSKDLVTATLVNLEACSDALYCQGPEIHEKYRKILQSEALKLGKSGNFRTWRELDEIYLDSREVIISSGQLLK